MDTNRIYIEAMSGPFFLAFVDLSGIPQRPRVVMFRVNGEKSYWAFHLPTDGDILAARTLLEEV